jgi:Tfp pilus assembly protein PilN
VPRVNLVPIEEQRKEFRRRFYIVPVAGAAILLIAMGSTYYAIDRQVSNTQQEYEDYQRSNAAQAPQVKELAEYESIQDDKQGRLDTVVSLYSQRVRWSRIMDDLSFVIPEEIWLDTISGTVPGLVITEKKTKANEQKKYDFTVKGFTRDMDTVAILMVRMALIPGLTDVHLVSAEREQIASGGLAINFEVGADLASDQDTTKPAVAPTTGEEGPSAAATTGTGTTNTGTTGTTGTNGTSTGAGTGGTTTGAG